MKTKQTVKKKDTLRSLADAESAKDLGISKTVEKTILKERQKGTSYRKIAEDIGVPRRRVMRVIEINGLETFSEGAYR